MAPSRLDNYLTTHRKHSGLSQRDVAWIVEAGCGDVISRFETGNRLPTLAVALRLEILFGVPIGALFAGERQRLARRIEQRITIHYRRIAAQPTTIKGRRSPAREVRLQWHSARRASRKSHHS